MVARLGGDEFVVLAPHDAAAPAGEEGAAVGAAVARLRETLARHNAQAERPYTLDMSLGLSRYDPAAPRDIDALLEAADQQMYLQKNRKHLARA